MANQHEILADTRETVEPETRYNTFEVLMQRVDTGELTFPQAIAAYRAAELAIDTVIVR